MVVALWVGLALWLIFRQGVRELKTLGFSAIFTSGIGVLLVMAIEAFGLSAYLYVGELPAWLYAWTVPTFRDSLFLFALGALFVFVDLVGEIVTEKKEDREKPRYVPRCRPPRNLAQKEEPHG